MWNNNKNLIILLTLRILVSKISLVRTISELFRLKTKKIRILDHVSCLFLDKTLTENQEILKKKCVYWKVFSYFILRLFTSKITMEFGNKQGGIHNSCSIFLFFTI